MNTSTDRIEKEILLNAPRSRVWRAISDAGQFGAWFQVKLEGDFAVGKSIAGQITYPGYEHLRFEATVEKMEPESFFSYRWRPTAGAPTEEEKACQVTTLVQFQLEDAGDGTRLTLTESGFDNVPAEFRAQAYRRNDGGWTEQMESIRRHVGG